MFTTESFYDVAARSGLLHFARAGTEEAFVDFRSPDELLLDGLAIGRDYVMRYPASQLTSLESGAVVTVNGQSYRVRSIRAVGDGSESQASLTR